MLPQLTLHTAAPPTTGAPPALAGLLPAPWLHSLMTSHPIRSEPCFRARGFRRPLRRGRSSVELLEVVQGATFLSHHLCPARLFGDTVDFTSPTRPKLIPITRELTKMDGISMLSSLSVMSRNSCPGRAMQRPSPIMVLGGWGWGVALCSLLAAQGLLWSRAPGRYLRRGVHRLRPLEWESERHSVPC